MKLSRAVVGGVVGGIVAIVIIRGAGWLSGADADVCALLGAVITGHDGATAWIIGCVAQLAEAALVAIVYAMIFEWVTERAGIAVGGVLGIPLLVVAGLSMGFLPGSRLLDAGIAAPGAFLEYRGAGVVAGFVLAHLAFGVIVGAMYGRPRHTVPTTMRVWRDATDTKAGQAREDA